MLSGIPYASAQNGSLLTITKPSQYNYNLHWPSELNQPYQVQSSPNLQTWANLGNEIIGNGNVKTVLVSSTAPKLFYRLKASPIRPGFDSTALPEIDDAPSTEAAFVGFTISLFGSTRSKCWVNNNGNITFGAPLDDYTPNPLGSLGLHIIAPFWADVDTRNFEPTPVGNVTKFGNGTVNGRFAFGVSWRGVGYFSLNTEKLNTFQLVVIDRSDLGAGNCDIEFNYGQILWETGDDLTSGGNNGYGGIPARAGISNGSNRTVELEYSGVTLAQLDANPITGTENWNTGLIHRSRGSTIPGRFVFEVRAGQIQGAMSVDAGPPKTLPAGVTTATMAGSASIYGGGGFYVLWSVFHTESGNSSVTFSNPNILNPVITMDGAEQSATLLLTVKSLLDHSIIAADVVTITR